ncbi:hypothetical protein [Mycobacteroides abscessus]|uniref:hypothetical protein n=1 Tax=Mycobacteroides abscessus TaxID=36809 RepID=UPI0009A6E190|nr:hypothetical protein [Mycobacteroides abscessus]SKF63555.1 Uncharacterised protein [Mycobacteroides abscessus subsp. bolletii]SKF64049.1 Uncharacterised protein [Mycobacteroides abscessus subsp. bolletii]SKF97290.1 Uncharacterised protein [Mycobacteroides abscessus subsp. bolletii]SKG02644.1 Uncharacterised protein [Mycobacteroides abscessus subsp. bolletii]SKG21325.1 Uncharacterised protein [Mycobacteroides abscessus subsp. bolletii]
MAKNVKQSKQQPSEYALKAISDGDFLISAIELGQRLSRHLTALENGEAGAVADVAAVLRTLIVRGEGDDVIRRLCKRMHVPMPQVLVSSAACDGDSVILSVGGIPGTPQDEEHPHQIPNCIVSLNEWSDMTALVVRGGRPKRANNWDRVISMYANTFGSHISGTIPNTLLETSSIMSGELDLGEYLIFCAGIVAEGALNQVLDVLAGNSIIVSHKIARKPCPLAHLTLRDVDRGVGEPALALAFMPAGLNISGDEIDVLKLHFAGRYMKASYSRRSDGKIYGAMTYSQQRPNWWV